MIAEGRRIQNHLYRMRVEISASKQNECESHQPQYKYQTFMAQGPLQSRETWDRQFGHISYSGLQALLEKRLVLVFTVDTQTLKPDCVTCMEAKMTEEPYNKNTVKETRPGRLTHMDLWDKYDIMSINGHQYYALLSMMLCII